MPRALGKRAAAVGTSMLVLLAIAYDLNPVRAFLAVEREYRNDGALGITIGNFAVLTMLTKNSFIDELGKQYVLTARAKGLSEQKLLELVDALLTTTGCGRNRQRPQPMVSGIFSVNGFVVRNALIF